MGYLDRGGDTRGLRSSRASGEHAAGTDVDDDRGEVRDAWEESEKEREGKRGSKSEREGEKVARE